MIDRTDFSAQFDTKESGGSTTLEIGLIHNQTFTVHSFTSEGHKDRRSALAFAKPFAEALKNGDWNSMPKVFQDAIGPLVKKLERDVIDGKIEIPIDRVDGPDGSAYGVV